MWGQGNGLEGLRGTSASVIEKKRFLRGDPRGGSLSATVDKNRERSRALTETKRTKIRGTKMVPDSYFEEE